MISPFMGTGFGAKKPRAAWNKPDISWVWMEGQLVVYNEVLRAR